MIVQLFSNLVATVVVLPPFVLLCFYLVAMLFKSNRFAFRTAIDYSTPFFILALFVYANYLFPTYGLLLMSIVAVLWAVALFVFIQWINSNASVKQKRKVFWRMCFLSAAVMYCFFVISAIVSHVF